MATEQKEPGVGHNSAASDIARDQLRSFCERLERLAEEKKTIAEDMKQVKGEAKGMGFDVSMINEMLKLRAMDRDERLEREAIRDTYGNALGIFG